MEHIKHDQQRQSPLFSLPAEILNQIVHSILDPADQLRLDSAGTNHSKSRPNVYPYCQERGPVDWTKSPPHLTYMEKPDLYQIQAMGTGDICHTLPGQVGDYRGDFGAFAAFLRTCTKANRIYGEILWEIPIFAFLSSDALKKFLDKAPSHCRGLITDVRVTYANVHFSTTVMNGLEQYWVEIGWDQFENHVISDCFGLLPNLQTFTFDTSVWPLLQGGPMLIEAQVRNENRLDRRMCDIYDYLRAAASAGVQIMAYKSGERHIHSHSVDADSAAVVKLGEDGEEGQDESAHEGSSGEDEVPEWLDYEFDQADTTFFGEALEGQVDGAAPGAKTAHRPHPGTEVGGLGMEESIDMISVQL
ncbi:uncharacterized protein J7T54_001253 [Emericellopsis cladophorae]|uniref:Uncharacterized protein n=1 Tax=Emericellopsis cladophorae TaxID=2686198 RepID=A0A9P9Y2P1_9HYPO|nr:uncharacterized protein J7T54_001253 [Emericellopsis cladophorae]KAI6782396.1 hypothetical protein J7T54_001253 [Emericellopsis cladophorae]